MLLLEGREYRRLIAALIAVVVVVCGKMVVFNGDGSTTVLCEDAHILLYVLFGVGERAHAKKSVQSVTRRCGLGQTELTKVEAVPGSLFDEQLIFNVLIFNI